MPRSRPVIALLLLAVAAIAMSACGGSGKTSDTTPTVPSGASPAATAAGTPASGGTAEATGSVDPEIKAVQDTFANSTFNATYKVTGFDPESTVPEAMTIKKDGSTRFRFEVATKQDGVDTTIIFIETGDASAFCVDDAGDLGVLLGVESGKGVCFKTTPGDANNPVGSLRDLFKDVANANVTLIEKSTRKVVGQDGTCYKTKDNATSEISTACFTSDGIMLYVKTEGDSPSEIEAQTVSTSVSDADFNLPYEERELPTDLGGGG